MSGMAGWPPLGSRECPMWAVSRDVVDGEGSVVVVVVDVEEVLCVCVRRPAAAEGRAYEILIIG